MTPTPEDLARDLAADLALCEGASPGPWFAYDSRLHPHSFTAGGVFLAGSPEGTLGAWQIVGGCPSDPREGGEVLGGTWGEGTSGPSLEDMAFVVTARQGWPAAIRRALAAEAEVVRLKRVLLEVSIALPDLVEEALGKP
jgi:hypothetical protein